MDKKFTVSLAKIIQELSLVPAFMPVEPETVFIESKEVNRPGIELTGYLRYFDNTRIVVAGMAEMSFLADTSKPKKLSAIEDIFSLKPPAVIICRGIQPPEEMLLSAEEHSIPILTSEDTTSSTMAALISFLNVELAERITQHGVFVEVYGEGILLVGDSGVGKSETAIELVKRGPRRIADDAVEIKKVSQKSLVGSSPDNIRHYIELRGIGIINARRIFGMGAVKASEKIDVVIHMEQWDVNKLYDRMGMDNEYTEILGISVPLLTIPIKPGRNLAIIIEVAAMNNRQKKMGYNASMELLANLGMDPNLLKPKSIKKDLSLS